MNVGETSETHRHQAAWAMGTMGKLASPDVDGILGALSRGTAASEHDATPQQINAWRSTIDLLAVTACKLIKSKPETSDCPVLLEYPIPRRGKRIDAVVLCGGVIFSLEIKVNADSFSRADRWQAEDYALDLRDFHDASQGREVIPVLVATRYEGRGFVAGGSELGVRCVGPESLASTILDVLPKGTIHAINAESWDRAAYAPTPTIVEATTQLFRAHSVRDLGRSDADNLSGTVDRVVDLVRQARSGGSRLLCFVTGVPGAGKTLAGLAAAASLSDAHSPDGNAAYMSGNGPLVKVLREAVARDAANRSGGLGEARRRSETLIQNVHEFTRHYGVTRTDLAPDERVLIFDEAQRAWDRAQLAKKVPSVDSSEPELVIQAMDRHEGWCAIVALVGDGQEIHNGEAGIDAWFEAIGTSEFKWRIALAPGRLAKARGNAAEKIVGKSQLCDDRIVEEPLCHLSVSVRSPRAERLSSWIDCVLGCDTERASRELRSLRGFRLAMTRDLDLARLWLRDAARDELRPGLVASSRATRLRAEGIEMSESFLKGYPIERWFLDGPDDYRSSYSLETAMSEFKIQGLEIDLAGVCWGGDLIPDSRISTLVPRRLRSTYWQLIKDQTKRRYTVNSYRVLLSRAREGMIIFVPRGSHQDTTRYPAEFDRIAELLSGCGVQTID